MNKVNQNAPLVSVILPAQNAQEFISDAIESILTQTYQNLELIVINDGSVDNTRKIVREIADKDKRVRLISYRKNKGESAAANLGFRKSRGEFIARMDADDIADPRRIEKQVNFLLKHPQHIVVGCQAHIIDEQNNLIGEKLFPQKHENIYREYGNLHPMLHPALMFRRQLLPWKGKLWANQAEPNDDYFTLFNYLIVGKFANLPQKLMFYRMHSNNKSMQHIKKKFVNSLKIRWYAFSQLHYRPALSTYLKLLTQTVLVLSIPESLTRGLYFYFKGIKSFDQSFPLVTRLHEIAAYYSQPEIILPMTLYAVLHNLVKKQ